MTNKEDKPTETDKTMKTLRLFLTGISLIIVGFLVVVFMLFVGCAMML